jgi:hypothetical protein
VFGGFVAEPWDVRTGGGSYYGSGQAFVFTFEDRAAYEPARAAELRRERDEEHAAIMATVRERAAGGSGGGAAGSGGRGEDDGRQGGGSAGATPVAAGDGEEGRGAGVVAAGTAAPPATTSAASSDFHFHVYRWTRRNKYWQLATPDGLGMGGGGHFAWFVDADLAVGSSGACATYLSPCLASGERFDCIRLELWAFTRRTVVW